MQGKGALGGGEGGSHWKGSFIFHSVYFCILWICAVETHSWISGVAIFFFIMQRLIDVLNS